MIPVIDRDHVTEVDPGQFATDTSTLMLFPGEVWPMTMRTSLGNGQQLRLVKWDDERARYRQDRSGIDVVVFCE